MEAENNTSRLNYVNKVFHVSLWGNILLSGLKGVIGVMAGSTAMIADALHSVSDVLSTVVAVGGLKYAHRPPDEDHHYGHGKAEIIATKIVALILIITALGMGWAAVQVIRQAQLNIPGVQAVWAAIVSLIIKEAMFQYTFRIGQLIKSNAIITDAWHHRSDALSSIAALIGIVGAIYGFPILDPLAGLVVAILILKMGIKVYWNSLKDLMDPAPDLETVKKIINVAENIAGVRSIQDVKARQSGPEILVDMKICVNPKVTVETGHEIAANCRHRIVKEIEEVGDVMIHVNPCYQMEVVHECSECERRQRFQEEST
ncbi:MAG: cation transporter [Clostridia bacterium]|nr:cation transporter [Clostridia bacterium]